MQFQDQLTNLFSQLLEVVKQDLFSVAVLNEDVFPNNDDGKKAREEFKSLLRNKELYASTQLLSVSFKQLEQLGIKPDEAFVVFRSKPNESITNIFTAITQVIGMAKSRDGANRPAGPAEAQAAMSFLQGLGSREPDIQKAVVSLLELFNTIMRSIDAGVDLKLQPQQPNGGPPP